MQRALVFASIGLSADAFHLGAVRPRAASVVMSEASTPSTNFMAVYHTFPKGASPEEWWANVADADMAAMAKAQHAEGVFNHFFLPGARRPDPVPLGVPGPRDGQEGHAEVH